MPCQKKKIGLFITAIYKCLKGNNFKTRQTRIMVLVLYTSSNDT